MECFLISPLVRRPSVVCNSAISKIVKEAGFIGNKFPYKKDKNTLNVTICSYFEKYIVLTVKYTEVDVFYPVDLKSITLLHNYPELYKLVLFIAGMIKFGNYKNITPLTSVPTLRCTSIEMLNEDFNFEVGHLVESLTGHMQPVKNIIDDVLERNQGHQLNEALTLIDKQGVIQRIPYDFTAKKEAQKKYISCCNLFELMIVINKTIQDNYLGLNRLFIKSISDLVRNPGKVINSFTARKTIEQFVKDFHLASALSNLESDVHQEILLNDAKKIQKEKQVSFKKGFQQFIVSK